MTDVQQPRASGRYRHSPAPGSSPARPLRPFQRQRLGQHLDPALGRTVRHRARMPTCPATELILTTEPAPLHHRRTDMLAAQKLPVRFTSMIACQSSRLVFSMPRQTGLMPALLTSTSTRPNRASAASRSASTSASRDTSATCTSGDPPIAAAASSSVVPVRPSAPRSRRTPPAPRRCRARCRARRR